MKTIALVHSSCGFHSVQEFEGIMRVAKAHSWNVQPILVDLLLERKVWQARLVRNLEIRQPAGIVADWHMGLASFIHAQTSFRGIPLVAWDGEIDRLPKGMVCTYSDSERVVADAVRELIATGFSHFAYFPMPGRAPWSICREKAFTQKVGDCGYEVLRATDQPGTIDELDHIAELKRFVASLPRPCAAFAANDLIAARVLTACRELAIDVPNEVAVLGVDDDKMICENVQPTLSSIRSNYLQGGFLAAELLARMMENPTDVHSSVFFGTIGVSRRQSTTILRCPDVRVSSALEYIRTKACDGITVADVVREMGVSRRNAEVLFRKCYGSSILDAILRARIDRVKVFLTDPNRMVKAVSDFCGFNSAVDMARAFRRLEGCSPTEWRSARRTLSLT